MDLEIARQVLTTALTHSNKLEESIHRVKEYCDDDVFQSYRRFTARVMGYLFTEIIGPIYDEHPELAPEWYKSSPKLDAKSQLMSKKIHEELSALINDVEREVVATTALVDQACPTEEARRYGRRVDEVQLYIAGVKSYLDAVGVNNES